MYNSVNNLSNNTKRIGGLASGLDTDYLVSQMMRASKMRVQKVVQQKIVLEWKQDYYKEVVTKLNDFQKKYFGSSLNSLSVIGDFTKRKPVNFSSPYVSVNPSSSSVSGNIYIDDIISLASSARIESDSSVSASPKINADPEKISELTGKSLNINLDGVEKTITFSGEYNTADDVKNDLQNLLNNTFGSNRISVDINGDELTINAQSGSTVIIKDSGKEGEEASSVLSFKSGDSNRFNLSEPLSNTAFSEKLFTNPEDNLSFKINGKEFIFDSTKSMNDIMREINSSDAGVKISYSSFTDKFTIKSTETGSGSDIIAEDTEGSFYNTFFGAGNKTAGTDAVVRLSANGLTDEENLITITRGSNSFDVEGTSISLLGKAAGNEKENISITLEPDTETMVTTIKEFVKDYNEMLDMLTSKLSEKRYNDFLPLTEDQKKEMTEKEVSLWTDKAKSGLFQNDMYLKAIANDLRNSFLVGVNKIGSSDETIGMMFADAGITTAIYSEKGKLHIDEQKLRNAISKDPNKVIDLFSQKPNSIYSQYAAEEEKQKRFNEAGLFWRISDIMQKNLSKTGIKGAIIELVGSPGDTYNNNQTEYGKRIAEMDRKIQTLNDKMTDEENRYWKQFSAMEAALSKLNSQSSWLSQQFSQKFDR